MNDHFVHLFSRTQLKLFLLLLNIIFSTDIYATPLKVAFGENRAPYIFEQGKELSGIEFDIIKEALLLGGYTIDYSKLPNKRLNLAISRMNYDVAVGVLDHVSPLQYSSEYMQVKNYAVAKASKKIKLVNVSDLQKYSVGSWPLAWDNCGEEFKRIFAPDEKGNFKENYIEPLNSEIQNKMFWRNRFDIAITNKVTFQYYKKSFETSLNTDVDVVFYDLIPDDIKFKVVFKNEKVRDDFESGLSQLKRNKRYLRIFQYYIQ